MISTAEILFMNPNTVHRTAMIKTTGSPTAFRACAKMIREGGYSQSYDWDQDGYVTPADYNAMYDTVYRLWDLWHSGGGYKPELDIMCLVHLKKILAGQAEHEDTLDLDGDGVITEQDSSILRFWLLLGKVERETFD